MKVIVQLLLPRRPEDVFYKGENITKLKFPCLCTFGLEGQTQHGILTKAWDIPNDLYELHTADQQEDLRRQFEDTSLLHLLEHNNVELKEGEIVFYDS